MGYDVETLSARNNPQIVITSMATEGDRCSRSILGNKVNTVDYNRKDGGARGWLVMFASFCCNGIIFGTINSYGLIYSALQKRLELAGVDEASSQAAFIGSLTIGATFFLSPIASILTDHFGLRKVAFAGGLIASVGMFLSSLYPDDIQVLSVGYGLMFGTGAALSYTPSLAILGHYFDKYLGAVNGIVTAGSSVFTICLPYVLDSLLTNRPFFETFRFLAAISVILMLVALIFKPVTKTPKIDHKSKSRGFVNFGIWRNYRYLIWALMTSVALFGYFVPYVHMAKYVELNFPGQDIKLPTICIGISSGIGRLFFGFIGDLKQVNRIILQQIAFISIGILTMLLTIVPTYGVFLTIAFAMGIFDGCFISLLGPIAFQLCGQKNATQAIGFQLGMSSLPLMFGPPIAGLLYDHSGSYTLPFLLSGLPPIIGGSFMTFVHILKPVSLENGDVESPLKVKDLL